MDQNLSDQQTSQQPVMDTHNSVGEPSEAKTAEGKKGFLKALVLLEVGLFEFLFVGIVLVLFFGILNYFNIISNLTNLI